MANGKNGGWSPYLCGALAGVLLVLSVLVAGKFFGASTTFARSAGMIEQVVASDRVASMAYFQRYVPKVDWQFMFVLGVLIGSLLSALASRELKIQWIPDMWAGRHGRGAFKRVAFAFCGGILVLFGARMAGGCPTGHGMSGLIQMSLSGFVAISCYFIGGAITSRLVYGGRDR